MAQLHIDADEAFTTGGEGVSVEDHFACLTRAGVTTMTYANHEAVAETGRVADPFAEATLFRRSPADLDVTDVRVAQGVALWTARNPYGHYFLGEVDTETG